MSECKCCKKANPENTYRFAIVNRCSTSSTKNYIVAEKTTTTVYENLVGFEKSSCCNSCIKKERVIYVLKWTSLIAFGMLCTLSLAALKAGSFGAWFFIVLGAVTFIGALGLFFYSLSRKDAFFAADIRARAASDKSAKYTFVPMDANLYCEKGSTKPNLYFFKQRGGLRTRVADKLFERYLIPDNSDEQIDSLLG